MSSEQEKNQGFPPELVHTMMITVYQSLCAIQCCVSKPGDWQNISDALITAFYLNEMDIVPPALYMIELGIDELSKAKTNFTENRIYHDWDFSCLIHVHYAIQILAFQLAQCSKEQLKEATEKLNKAKAETAKKS